VRTKPVERLYEAGGAEHGREARWHGLRVEAAVGGVAGFLVNI